MELILTIGICILWGLWGQHIAKKHGFNELVAFIVCFLTGFLGIIGYAIAGKVRKDKIRDARIEKLLMEKEAKKQVEEEK
jgi:hypothetical protein